MKSNWVAVAFATIALSLVEATVSTYSQTGCVTKRSTKSANKVPTSTKSYTLTFNPKVTVVTTPTSTVIPPSTTVTAITTSTSTVTEILSQVTDTATETITNTETESTTTTLIATEITTLTDVVTSSTTMTIPASAGFTPLASQLTAAGYTVGTVSKRSAAKRIARTTDEVGPKLDRRAGPLVIASKSGAKQYPVAVSCYRFVQVVSVSTVKSTARSTQTITAIPGTITATSTTIEPTTTTSMPLDASTTTTTSTTTTITETATETSTTTSTLTTTSTSLAPIATFYAACGSDNQVSSVNGKFLYTYNPRFAYEETTAPSAYDCCVRCLQSSVCSSSLFNAAYGNYCGLVSGSGTCNPTEETEDIYANGSPDAFSVASNSNCGRASSNIQYL